VKQSVFIIVILFVFKPVFPLIEYGLNYDYIAKVLCENKAKPELKCNGKCHLMKQLAKASEAEKSDSKDKKNSSKMEWEIPFVNVEIESITGLNRCFYFMELPTYSNQYSFSSESIFFHPPTV
jgi:hypothetical protein